MGEPENQNITYAPIIADKFTKATTSYENHKYYSHKVVDGLVDVVEITLLVTIRRPTEARRSTANDIYAFCAMS